MTKHITLPHVTEQEADSQDLKVMSHASFVSFNENKFLDLFHFSFDCIQENPNIQTISNIINFSKTRQK